MVSFFAVPRFVGVNRNRGRLRELLGFPKFLCGRNRVRRGVNQRRWDLWQVAGNGPGPSALSLSPCLDKWGGRSMTSVSRGRVSNGFEDGPFYCSLSTFDIRGDEVVLIIGK